MLTLTDNAAEVVAKITEQNVAAEEAGLRISQSGTADETRLALSPVDAPEPGDQTIVEGSARVFLDANAAMLLDDKLLDAQVDPDGSVQFGIAEQA